jgi:hypothetical protein
LKSVKLSVVDNVCTLIIPQYIAKLYGFMDGQVFDLEIKESNNDHKIIFLTYVTKIK